MRQEIVILRSTYELPPSPIRHQSFIFTTRDDTRLTRSEGLFSCLGLCALGLRSPMRVSAAPGGCEVRVRRRLSRSAAPN
ncbi:hypothetical protein E2C01_035966 [Portunus trituberculatus]|uniref:Uncharacterized protein n=1 Tax=Portunus trituberculatus TaxID=210409 RepID=A0A5B7FAK6_PORTR|nr:hypothetical protein [Portunus trituberculatus]